MRYRALAGMTLVFGWAAVPRAAERVVFQDGRHLIVERWTARGPWIQFELEKGGAFAVPLELVASIEPLPPRLDEEIVRPGWQGRAGDLAPLIESAASHHGLDPELLVAIIEAESGFDPFAVSRKGACGLMQLMPETAARFGVSDVFDPRDNLEGGARYLRWLLERFQGNQQLALAAYNAGEGAVDRYGGIPPYPETRSYVSRVLGAVAASRSD